MSFPYSLFKGLQAPQPNSPIDRRDLLNYTGDNTIQSSRYIDPATGDFVVSSTNHFEGMNAIEQAVLLAVNTTFGSSAQPGFGQNFLSPKLITNNVPSQMTTLLQQCLADLIANKQITLQQVTVTNNDIGQVSIQFVYNNNTIGTTASLSFILP